MESRDFYTLRKRRLVRIYTLPDIAGCGFLIQACRLVIYLMELIY
jgi:hypothetical protein